jgi:hypothetical protein
VPHISILLIVIFALYVNLIPLLIIPVVPLKASKAILVAPSAEIDFILVLFKKALNEISVTELGNITELTSVIFSKARRATLVASIKSVSTKEPSQPGIVFLKAINFLT